MRWPGASPSRKAYIKFYVAPGNAGTERESGLQNVNLADPVALATFAEREGVHLTVVGPEAPLAAGIVNVFRARGLKIFGPTREAAQANQERLVREQWCE